MLDGTALRAFTPSGRFRERFGLNLGRVMAVKVQGGAGAVVKDMAVLPALRGEALS
jgi:hypothetical protein